MPFEKSFDDVYKLGIKSTCENLNTYCERVDEQIFQGSILDRILNQISKADIIIADMTGKNANVFFEVGYAKALDKKIILLTASVNDIPFDLKHFTHVIYDNSIVDLKENLNKHLKFYLANLDNSSSSFSVGVNLYIMGIKLASGNITKIETPVNYNYIPVVVENISGKTLESNSFQLVIRGDDYLFHNKKTMHIENVKGDIKHAIYNELPIFHASEQSFGVFKPPREIGKTKIVEVSIFSNNFNCHYKIELIGAPK